MAHKSRYIAKAKKKRAAPAITTPGSAPIQKAEVNTVPVARMAPATARPVAVAAVPASVKYANLPRDFRQVAMLMVIILAVLIIAWLILK